MDKIIKMSDIIIHSHKRSNNFTIVPNHIINAEYLTLEEKMLLIWMLSKPQSWKLSTKALSTIHDVGKNKITDISKSLQLHNHLLIERLGNGSVKWHIYESPSDCTKITRTVNASLAKTAHPRIRDKEIVQETYKDVRKRRASPLKSPHPQNPDLVIGDVLVRTDPLTRTIKKRSCSPDDELTVSEIEFNRLWDHWPKKQNKKDSRRAFNRVVKSKADTDIKSFVNMLILDVTKRMEVNQFSFLRTLLSSYLSKERWDDEIPVKEIDAKQQKIDDAKKARQASDDISRKLFRPDE